MAKTGYVDGGDLLLYVNGKAIGSCTSHQSTFSSETKDRVVKAVAKKGMSSGKWKSKSVVGLSYSISSDSLRFYNETETGFKTLLGLWKQAKSVSVKLMERAETGNTDTTGTPYLVGLCVISSITENAGAGDDATFSLQLESDGEPETLDETKITEVTTE